MKINWGLVIAGFLLVGIGAHVLRRVPERAQPVPTEQIAPAPLTLIPLPAHVAPVSEPVALPPVRPKIPEPLHVRHPQPKPKESKPRPIDRRAQKDGALGGESECAKVRPSLSESERAAYENSSESLPVPYLFELLKSRMGGACKG